jgi:hypothetical protein
MYIVTATAPNGMDLSEKRQSAREAYMLAEKWLASGYLNIGLMEEGGQWHHGAEQIRRFMAAIKQMNGDA